MQWVSAFAAKPSARGSDLYMLLGCSDTAVFNAMRPRRVGFFGSIGGRRHFSHSPTRSPSSSVFTSLINDPAIQPLLMTVAV